MRNRRTIGILMAALLLVSVVWVIRLHCWRILNRRTLHFAVEEGDIETIRKVLESGNFDVDMEDTTSRTPLYLAAMHGEIEAVRLLLEHGADINHVAVQKSPETALHIAAAAGHLDVVRLLVERGADINSSTSFGSTPLCHAAWNSKTAVLEWLIANGADVKVVCGNGQTPLTSTYRPSGYADVIQILADAGANVNHQGPWDITALHNAIIKRDKKAVMILLEKGADPNPSSQVRLSPLAAAEKRGLKEIADILRQHGAK